MGDEQSKTVADEKGSGNLEEEEKLKSAREISIKEGALSSVSDGFGVRNITPYALAIGKGYAHINIIIGLLSSLPSLIGNFAQLFSSRLSEKHSRKKIVIICVFMQAVMWLSLIIPGILYFKYEINSSPVLLLVFYTLLILFGAICGPLWSSWMRDIAPKGSSHYYFGRRNKISSSVSLSAMLLAGFVLDYFKQTHLFIAFAFLFFFSFVFRTISGFLFIKQYEPKFKPEEGYYFSFFQFVKKMRYNNFGRFAIFGFFISFAVAMASPFYSVYLINNLGITSLNFGYVLYMIIVLSSSLATILSLTFWGKLIDSYGCVNVMKITGFFIFIVPILWVFSVFFKGYVLVIGFLFLVELFSGFIFGGFDLANGNFVYDAVTRQRMTICISYLNFTRGIGVFLGAMFGGIMLSLKFSLFSLHPILILFIISGIIRFIVYFFFMPQIKEVRPVGCIGLSDVKCKIEKSNFIKYFNFRFPKPESAE